MIQWGTANHKKGLQATSRINIFVEAPLRERAHAVFYRYLCGSRCHGTEEQQQLCDFLDRLTYWMYGHMHYKDYIIMNYQCAFFYGCGPAFQMVASKIEIAITKLMKLQRRVCTTKSCACHNPLPVAPTAIQITTLR